jgi:UDP-glucose 4-epimerase
MTVNIRSAVVTGGAGFIGSHLVDALVARGCAVTVLDNLSTGREANLGACRASVRLLRGDIRDRQAMEEAVKGCDAVFHLAAIVSVVQTTEDPLGSASVNETGSLQVLEAARTAGVRRFVFASSCAVYGDDPALPKHEAMPPNPLTPYAVQKLSVEYYLRVYQALYGLDAVALRFFNVFGPRQDPSSPYSGVISIFMNRALTGDPPTIYGDGEQTRDFVYVGDVVEALIAAATSPSAPGGVFNVGTAASVSINDLWGRIATLSGAAVSPLRVDRRAGEVLRSRSSIDLARERLGFSPSMDLDQGLLSTLEWCRGALPAKREDSPFGDIQRALRSSAGT